MTSRFDMEGFIPAVVMEEERQHQVGEEDEDVDNDQLLSTSRDGIVGMQRSRHAIQLETIKRQQEKAARKKVLAAVGPRLEVLQNMPFVIPFETRVQIFRHFVYLDQTRRRGGQVDPDLWRMSVVQQAMAQNGRPLGREVLNKHHAKIRRDRVFEDAYNQFYKLGESLKEPIQITFVDKFDAVEAGIDGGGVTKEFLTSVTNEAFRASDGPNLFVTNDQNLLYPNPAALDERRGLLRQAGLTESSSEWTGNITDLLQQYRFLGRIIGKCLYEGILVDIGFAGFFLRKWASGGGDSSQEPGHRVNINDLRDLDESLYQGLLKLKNYPADVEDFSLDFTVTDTVSLPGEPTQTITRDLEFNGSSVSVTNGNRLLYITRIARYRLEVRPFLQTRAFLRGLGDIINPSWLSMFNQSELQTLIGGDSSEIDVEDLRHNTSYGGIYVIGDDGLEHPTIQLFWRVMKELDDSDRRKVLKYVTSTPRAPLLGFSQLRPRFSIRDAGNDEERLPSTSTCVNLLKLPLYSSAFALRQKLVYAVNSGAGFDLS
jgi:ubiquitin-protein ligase E3 C